MIFCTDLRGSAPWPNAVLKLESYALVRSCKQEYRLESKHATSLIFHLYKKSLRKGWRDMEGILIAWLNFTETPTGISYASSSPVSSQFEGGIQAPSELIELP